MPEVGLKDANSKGIEAVVRAMGAHGPSAGLQEAGWELLGTTTCR